GNPKHITTVAALSGKSISVEVGTTNKDFLDAQSKLLQKRGKKPIKVVTFPKDTDAALALKTGKVDAYFGDSPVVAYYIEKDPKSFAFGVNPVAPIPVGMAFRKGDPLIPKVRRGGGRVAGAAGGRSRGTWSERWSGGSSGAGSSIRMRSSPGRSGRRSTSRSSHRSSA